MRRNRETSERAKYSDRRKEEREREKKGMCGRERGTEREYIVHIAVPVA